MGETTRLGSAPGSLEGVRHGAADPSQRAPARSLPDDPVEPGDLGWRPGRAPGPGVARRALRRLLVPPVRLHPPPRLRPRAGEGPDPGLLRPRAGEGPAGGGRPL